MIKTINYNNNNNNKITERIHEQLHAARHSKPFHIHNTYVYNSVHRYLTKMIIQ